MKTFENRIAESHCIYKSQTSDSSLRVWPLKKTKCKLYLYEDVPCSDFERIICSTLHLHNDVLKADDLATILGFNVKDDFTSSPKRYKDDAEICIFNSLIKALEREELIKIEDGAVKLTSLGDFSVRTEKKRLFFEAECGYLENFSLTSKNDNIFPFRNALNITTEINNKKRVSFYKQLSNYDIEPQIKEDEKPIVDRLLTQLAIEIHIFGATLVNYDFTIESENIPVAIYNDNGSDFVVVYSKDGRISEYVSALINDEDNDKIKKIKIEWGYYLRLLNDPSATLDYKSLKQFEDIIEWEQIIKDKRFCWNDRDLFMMLSSNIDANIWYEISSICPISELKNYLNEYSENWDWTILSARIDGKFITENATNFPWNFDAVIHNASISSEEIEELLTNPYLTSIQWPWREIMPSLSNDFVIKHIDDVSFDLSLITEKEPSVAQNLILNYPDKAWDWEYISTTYDLDYILNNIKLLSKRLNLQKVTTRALSSEEFANKFCKSSDFKCGLKSAVEHSPSPINFNLSNLIWNSETIDFLEEIGVLSWCVPVIGGFENNPNINWDKYFFDKYSNRISSCAGYSCVTFRVSDYTIVDNHPNFNWDWNIISCKADWIKDTGFVNRHIAELNIEKSFDLMSSDTFCALFDNPFMQSFLSSHPEKRTRATELASIQLVKNCIDFDWNWGLLTIKTISTLKIERLGDKRWAEKWDWQYLSENLPITDISEYLFEYQDYWDWTVLTKRLDKDTIIENLADFADKWDWAILINDIFTKEELSVKGYLPTVATIISLKDEESMSLLWRAITMRFTMAELYEQIHSTLVLSEYSSLFHWDLSYMYDHKDFSLNEYINQYPKDVDWELLSKSKSAERLFFYDKTILNFKMWLDMVKYLLHYDIYHWDYVALSHNESINWHPAILKINKDLWDWQYLSLHSRCFSSTRDSSNLIKNVRQFKQVLDFTLLSERNDIYYDDALLKEFIDENWNWIAISNSEKLSISTKFLTEHQDKGWDWGYLSKGERLIIDKELLENTKHRAWDWKVLSSNKKLRISLAEIASLNITLWDWGELCARKDITFDNETLLSTIDKSYITWDWNLLSSREDLTYDEDFILKVWQKPMDWESVSRMDSFIPSAKVLSKISAFKLDWDAISQNNYLLKEVLYPYRDKLNWSYISRLKSFHSQGTDFYRKYRAYLDWAIISSIDEFTLSIENLKEFKDELDWNVINNRDDLQYSNVLLDELADYINWSKASKANTIEFSIDFVKKHIDRWDWFALVNNPLIAEHKYEYEEAFKDKINSVRFIARFLDFDSEPKVYHFAHLFNAVSIIKSKKILSRIGGEGLFENSAGSNVHRRDTAHHYARFYYRPQTPTQYYNEALGEDSQSSKEKWVLMGYDHRGKKIWNSYTECPTTKYWGAQRLGSPKCPMPVFFEFDLREILNHCLDKCYYSTGNMQGDNSQVVSIADDPDRLNTSHLYSTIDDGIHTYKAYSQQEFLVRGELDFSCLKNFRIVCYNEEQVELLKMLLNTAPICNHITTDTSTSSGISIFHRENRTISINVNDESLSFSTNYRDPSSIVVECEDIDSLDIIDKSHIINISNGKIQAYPSISLKTPSTSITVRFVDHQKFDSNSWVIYSNEKNISESLHTYTIITNQLVEQFELEVSKLQIGLSKSLFKEHMLNSYHGIGHTVRVMWNAFLIASIDNTISDTIITPVLYAALIHDLGKRSDTEGEIHGEHSATLYKTEIERYCTQDDASSILDAVKYHSVDDSKTPSHVRRNKVWEILKDADALDRSRLPGRGCNPAFLRNNVFASKKGKEILALAVELPSLCCNCIWDSPIKELAIVINSII